MFASGNNTERRRMGEVRGKDEFVVDLYAVFSSLSLRSARESGISPFQSRSDRERSAFFALKSTPIAWRR